MHELVSFALILAASTLLGLVSLFLIEIVMADPDATIRKSWRDQPRGRIAVLVPAHDEGHGLVPTVEDILAQLWPGDRLVVVADNCSDDTAVQAAKAGAEVIERHEPNRRGKGYALAHGVEHLRSDPPDVVIVIDADCRIASGVISELSANCLQTGRPAQAVYLMKAPEGAPISTRVAEFAWAVKNRLRPLGLSRLGLPCQLTGSGMAFPFAIIRPADLANGEIVEDMKLGLDLAAAGHPPVFCRTAQVTSWFASTASGREKQRQRWERGHLDLIVGMAPRLLTTAIIKRNWPVIGLALDLAIPPLSLLVLSVLGLLAISGIAAWLNYSSSAFWMGIAALLNLVGAGTLAWLRCGSSIIPAEDFGAIGWYVVGKVGFYGRIAQGCGGREWIRTDRTRPDK